MTYEQRVEAGTRELNDLARGMTADEAEEFFQAVAYKASNRARRLTHDTPQK